MYQKYGRPRVKIYQNSLLNQAKQIILKNVDNFGIRNKGIFTMVFAIYMRQQYNNVYFIQGGPHGHGITCPGFP